MNSRKIDLHPSWLRELESEFALPYMQQLSEFLRQEKNSGQTIYPRGDLIFNALNSTPLDQVKVVILGQDPYHGPGQAHGLSFSVPEGVKVPPSLVNIYKELKADLQIDVPLHGNLQSWANQGVLLLNSVLTVRESLAASHQGKGWERFTDCVIKTVSQQCQNVVFMLWGGYAKKKGQVIDAKSHLVLHAPHPSPLSAHRGFLGCKHFSMANQYLQSHGKLQIDWQVR